MTENNDKLQNEPKGESPVQENPPVRPEDIQNSSPEPPQAWQQPNQNPYGFAQQFGQNPNAPYNPNNQGAPQQPFNGPQYIVLTDPNDQVQFQSARKFVTASQILAVVSLFIGGVLLSGVAVALAAVGLSKLNVIAQSKSLDPIAATALKRPAVVGIAMAVVALVLNIVSAVMLYPIIMEAMNSGDISNLLGLGGSASTGTQSGSSTWG